MRYEEACIHLGVEPGSDLDEGRRAYKRRAQLLHPDRHANASDSVRAEAERAMKLLAEAWQTFQRVTRPATPPEPAAEAEPHRAESSTQPAKQGPSPATGTPQARSRRLAVGAAPLVAAGAAAILVSHLLGGGSKSAAPSPAPTSVAQTQTPVTIPTPVATLEDGVTFITPPGVTSGAPGGLASLSNGIIVPAAWRDSGLRNYGGPAADEQFEDPADAHSLVRYVANGGSNGLIHETPGTAPNAEGWTPNLTAALDAVDCTVTQHFRISAYEVGYSCASAVAGYELNGVLRIDRRSGYELLQTTLPGTQHSLARQILNSLANASPL